MCRKNKQMILRFIVFALLLIGVVYAILQANLQINGIAKIGSNTWDIHFDNIQVNPNSVSIGTGDSAATIDPENNCKVDFEVTLSTPGDFYEFTVDVVNAGSIDGMIGELNKTLKVNNETVSEVPNYLNYIVTYDDGDQIIPNHLLEAGDTLTYLVRLEFRTDIEELPEATTITTSLEPQYIQADGKAIEKLPYHPGTYDGELVQGAEYIDGQYTYHYMQEYDYYYSYSVGGYVSEWKNITSDGWGVTLTDKNSTDPVTTRLCTSINYKPIVSMSNMFTRSQTTSIDTSSFYTSNVVNMSDMFNAASSLTNIDLSSFDTSNVIDMSGIFAGCSGLTSIDISHLDTSSVTNMCGMFSGCSNLTSIDFTGFVTSKVTNMQSMFYNCSRLSSLDLSSFNTSSVIIMLAMFEKCSNLTSLNLSSFNTSHVTDMQTMFDGCSNLTSIDVSSFNTGNVTNMTAMFYECSRLSSLNLSNFNTSNVTSMQSMFSGCSSLTELNLSGFDFSNRASFSFAGGIFDRTTSLKKLNLSSWKLPTYMDNAIFRVGGVGSSIEEIDVSNWNLSNTSSISGLFADGYGLKTIKGLNSWNTFNINNMSYVFYGCSGLTSLDVTSFNTSSVTTMQGMFYGCVGLTSIDLSHFNTSNVTSMGVMFYGCSGLTSLDLSSFDTSRISTSGLSGTFVSCNSLTTAYAKTQADADRLNASAGKPSTFTFTLKS